MKKRSLIFLSILASTSALVFGCNKNDKNDKISLSFGDYTVNMENFSDYDATYKYDLTYAELEAKLGKENFAVAVCATDGCGCWTYLSGLIKDYVSRNHVVIYRIKDTEFVGKNDHGLKVIQNSSSFGLINLDKKARTISSANGDKETEKQNMFDAFMNRYSALPRMYYVSSNDVKNKIIKEGVNATVYFGRSYCQDCTYIDKHILIPYFQNHKGTLYIYDMQEVFNTPSYDQLKADFKMTEEKSEGDKSDERFKHLP